MSLTDPTSGGSDAEAARLPPRATWVAVKRGAQGVCPSCGEGRILYKYLKVHASCSACGEELHHHRADDFPPYLTILVVGHVLGGIMFAVDEMWPDLPLTFHFLMWPVLCVLMSLWLLPIFKGGLIAYQWALRMHGFETAHQPAPRLAGANAPSTVRQRSAA